MSFAHKETATRPFTIEIPESQLEDMRARIKATRWPEKETVSDQSQGVQLKTMQALARYWAEEYDWRKVEAKLKGLPHFVTGIDGLDIHFVHVRSNQEDALPLIVSHGWPGSIMHYLKVIEPLTNPTAHGGDASDAFHVVIPSMPGFGFSAKPSKPGWDPARIARAWGVLMKRLGYAKYVAQGGDWGAIVVDQMGLQAPEGLLGIHTNMAGAVPPEIDNALQTGKSLPSGLSAEEQRACEELASVYKRVAYAQLMGTRPQTLTVLADSPAGLAAFILDFDAKLLALITRTFAGKRESLTRDDVLDNLTLFWLTGTAVSSARIYWENKLAYFAAKGVSIPVAVSVFPDELYKPPRSWAEKAYPNLVHYNRHEKGGHFPAWEQPELFVDEVRGGFRPIREMSESETPYMPSFDEASTQPPG